MPYFYLSIAIVFEVIGTVALKLSEGFTKPLYIALVVIGWGAAAFLLALCLRTFSVSFTYAVWAGFGIVLVALIGVVFLGEKSDWPGIIGIAFIITGVIILNGFSKMSGG